MTKYTEDVFVTEGVPLYTFVKPPNYNDILLDIRKPGKPVIIEGQSGTGKTTTTKKIVEQLMKDVTIKNFSSRKTNDIEKIIELANNPQEGYYIIDDFHRLSSDIQDKLANIAKVSAEEGEHTTLPKLILIGINQIGSALISLVPDIAKRCGIHKIFAGDEETIKKLILKGSEELNIHIPNPEIIYQESQGDYWLTQILCRTICALHSITETQEIKIDLNFELNDLRDRVVNKLNSSYHEPVKEFCRGKRFRRSNDPYFKLLSLIGQQDSSIVDLTKLANQYEEFKGSINNIKDRRLDILLQTKEGLNKYFYYNSDSKSFAIEDPALFYFLKHLNWNTLRDDCGFSDSVKNYEFDIAISFAGENRHLASIITKKLEIFDISIFFDTNYESNLLGKALSKELTRIFGQDSRFVICLLDKIYLDKIWPAFERETFTPRIVDETVIPIYLDDSKFVGIPQDTYGVKLHDFTEDDLDNAIIKIVERIG